MMEWIVVIYNYIGNWNVMEKYDIRIKRSAAKELKAIPLADVKKILKIIGGLAQDPRPYGCQKLSGKDWYRIRCGVYRILYAIKDFELIVYVIKIGHRKDVYRS